ncbi:PhnD/SsuA/transferrin family substrate-binding protein [Neorhizobium tomejilense]|uniref:substrate-binding domain-containing protein n=1 Tax=Neorhizobium tomejilense TaxID=2093828 RepID=UPI00155E5F14|nr:PhnD/SsuA/transferrin family substrate-binding protein [Neorhizobium tomejilense]
MAYDDPEDHCRHTGTAGVTRRTVVGAMIASAASVAAPALGAELAPAVKEGTLRFGLTPVFLSNDLEVLDELQGYLSEATQQEVQLVTQRTYQEVTALLVSGNLEAAWICGYPYMKYRNELEVVASPVWRGKPLYQSYLIVAADRAATSFEDCMGDIHAFSDPDSNSGYLVTKAYLSERHVSEERFFRKSFFTYGHRNVIRAVASGLAQSGSVDGYVWEVMLETEPELVGRTRILVKSQWHGFPPVAAARRLTQTPMFTSIQNALLDMDGHPVGRSVLQRLRLDSFIVPPNESYDSIAANMEVVRRLG